VTLPAESVSVELPPAVTAPGLKDAVAPEGSPLAESVTVSADPLMAAVEIVDVALPPCTAETLLGLALIEKSLGAGVTVSMTVVLCVALGAMPVTVTEYGPGVVAAPTLKVNVEPPPAVVVGGLNEAVAPAGTPPALSVTVSAEPLVTAVEMVDVPLPPWTADTLAGFAPIEKSLGAAVTVSVTVMLWIALGAVPVTVTEYGPGVVAAPTLSVSVELPPAATDPGLKDADAPEGSPLAESVTVSADPLITAVEMVDVALPPWTADTLLGLALIEKLLGAAVTVSVTVVLCVALGAVPVTVTE